MSIDSWGGPPPFTLQPAAGILHVQDRHAAGRCLLLLQVYSGGSVDGAAALARGDSDIAFNWSGEPHVMSCAAAARGF